MPRGKCETITSKNDIEVTAIGPELICPKPSRAIEMDTHENNSHRFCFSRRYFVVDCATPPSVSAAVAAAAVSFFRCDTHNIGSIYACLDIRYSYARHIYIYHLQSLESDLEPIMESSTILSGILNYLEVNWFVSGVRSSYCTHRLRPIEITRDTHTHASHSPSMQ